MHALEAPTEQEIAAARERIRGSATRTPLVRLDVGLPVDGALARRTAVT